MTPLTSNTSRLLLLGTRGKLPVLPVKLGFEGARYRVLRGLLSSAAAPLCLAAAASTAAHMKGSNRIGSSHEAVGGGAGA